MKKIIIVHNYSKKSYNGMSYALANKLAENNEVLFISHDKILKEDLKNLPKSLKVINWPNNNYSSYTTIFWVVKLLLNFKPNVVLGHFRGGMLVGILAKLTTLFQVKNIQYYHTNYMTSFGEDVLNSSKKNFVKIRYTFYFNFFCNLIICPSEYSKKDIQKYFKMNKTKVIYNGLFDFFQEKLKDKSKIKIGFLGRFDENKGVFLLIRAYKKYKLNNPKTKIILNIAGYGTKENVLKISNLLKNTDIINVGSLDYDSVVEYFASLNYSIVPSKIDNLPTTGIESLMQGTPVAISDNNGLAECIEDNLNSFIIKHEELSIYNWLKKAEVFEAYNEMSQNARKLYLDKFEVNKNVKFISELILN